MRTNLLTHINPLFKHVRGKFMFIVKLLHEVIRYPVQLRQNYKERKLLKKRDKKFADIMKRIIK